MLEVKRSGSGKYWHVMYNNVRLECCDTKRQAFYLLEVYKSKVVGL